MKRVLVGGVLDASAISLGLWRLANMTQQDVNKLLETAVECGIDFLDTADIYGGGKSEEMMGQGLRETGLLDKVKVQTKCGIRKGMYDFSKSHIISSVEGSLKRLGFERIDVLLLHRPDALVEPEEVAEAFDRLYASGKVSFFGVSNHNPMQMELLRKYLPHRMIANQLQFGLAHSYMVNTGINMNTSKPAALERDGSVLDYCRLNDITIQAWSPLQYGFFEGCFLGNYEKYPELNEVLDQIAGNYGVEKAAIAFAWILRHPARMQAITGTTNPEHLKALATSVDIELTRAEWYELHIAAGNKLP